MANAVIILILIVLIAIAIRRIYRTVRYGGSCCGSGSAMDKKVRVKDRNKANYPIVYMLKIDGMVCAGCVRKVENALNSEGDLWAKADLENKAVRVLSKKKKERDDFTDLLKTTPYTLLEMTEMGR
ncbi:Heavy-metal-associated domain-containing protein [Lachnospiraceae bacterium XBB2008]|nr:Heavy-metal-associated domain-containing protein [Lachnospiraceae bacterium XBB2008]